ncbi:MAG TPA: hypothetical protein VHD56_17795 [Tepidisphaeraceae bacterium]|nr:hypothetical protein [Tepidisphaeraceae bacterium]
MIGDWWHVAPGQYAQGTHSPGWSCDNDVHEHFRVMAKCVLPNAFVLEREDGALKTWNCAATRVGDVLRIAPAEDCVSRVHLNLHKRQQVEVAFASGSRFSGDCSGMSWIGPGGEPPSLRQGK